MLGIVAAVAPGSGHLARSLALAQAWSLGGGRVVLVPGGPVPHGWAERYADAGAVVAASGAAVAPDGAEAWVVDGYDLPADLPGRLRTGGPVAVVDDGGQRGRYDADWVVDQNLGADDGPYRDRSAECRLLLGARYAMLRTDVVAARPAAPPDRHAAPRRLLVALGGDPTPEASALFDAALAGRLDGWGLERVELRGVVDVGALLATVDLALTAAGSTVWELCAHGVPAAAVVVADNQQVVARRAGEAGLVVDAGTLGSVGPEEVAAAIDGLVGSPERRTALARRAWTAIDGRGARRVAVALRGSLLALRPAVADDVELVWRWANDPAVRRSAFSSDPIPLDQHRRWFAARRADPATALWLAHRADGTAVGQVRLELDADRPEVALLDYSVAAAQRGQGWAPPLLDAAARRAFEGDELGDLDRIEARVRPDNAASARALAAADFGRGPDGSDGSAGAARWHTYTRSRHG